MKIGCDSVAWILDSFHRHLPPHHEPSISREREMRKFAMLYEIMEVLDLEFEDDAARRNGTPSDARAPREALTAGFRKSENMHGTKSEEPPKQVK